MALDTLFIEALELLPPELESSPNVESLPPDPSAELGSDVDEYPGAWIAFGTDEEITDISSSVVYLAWAIEI